MTTIDPTAMNKLKFAIGIEGSDSSPKCRLSIPLNDKVNINIEAEIVNEVAYIEIPPIMEYLDKGVKSIDGVKFEVFIDESYIIPWEGSFELIKQKPEISLTLESTESKKVKKNIGVRVESIK